MASRRRKNTKDQKERRETERSTKKNRRETKTGEEKSGSKEGEEEIFPTGWFGKQRNMRKEEEKHRGRFHRLVLSLRQERERDFVLVQLVQEE